MTLYEADPETQSSLEEDLFRFGRPMANWGNLFSVEGPVLPTIWHRNIWPETLCFPFVSIGQTAKTLRSLGALWVARPQDQFRRHQLIQDGLPRFQPKPRAFPFVRPQGDVGVWTLGRDGQVWACPRPASPFPGGDPLLAENKIDPPSSAYRKLQEALSWLGRWPGPKDRCLDAGSSPGGWSWQLAELGTEVLSVDRAPLDPRVSQRPNVHFTEGNAFTWLPAAVGRLDWLFCDVACYPQKLWDWVKIWLESGLVGQIVVTIKLQGKTLDWEILGRFSAVPSSRIVHLFHNKHELTWLWPVTSRSAPVPMKQELRSSD